VLVQGAAENAGSVRRVPATEIEQLVVSSIRKRFELAASLDDRVIVKSHVARVEVQQNRLTLKLADSQATNRDNSSEDATLYIPWKKPPSKRRREILLPESASARDIRPIRSETRATSSL
jgi:site-specific DNA recombinase